MARYSEFADTGVGHCATLPPGDSGAELRERNEDNHCNHTHTFPGCGAPTSEANLGMWHRTCATWRIATL